LVLNIALQMIELVLALILHSFSFSISKELAKYLLYIFDYKPFIQHVE